jgi:hypothetical protein
MSAFDPKRTYAQCRSAAVSCPGFLLLADEVIK